VSDHDPRPSGAAPPPPPPPPDLAPPPGYAAYTPTLASAVPLKRVKTLTTTIVILLGVYVVGAVIAIVGAPGLVDSAEDFLANPRLEDEFEQDLATYALMGALAQAAQLAIVVLSIIWTYRLVTNHRTIGRQTTWGPGMAVGGWFLPPFLYVIPTLVLREAWKASDPTVPPGDERWKQGRDNPLLWLWFLVYGVGTVVVAVISGTAQFRQFGGDVTDVAEAYADSGTSLILGNIVGIVGAVLWALLVRQWSARHMALTGEHHLR
jgi:hypothetical protein